ncbi:uroporphyrinogen-III synthase [Salinibacterium sp. SYSU T00001]|uniref:uroporphyrinogen-III synthase n=1 Tax=Homoserinimonas sedimenticola TaxID=2986805 RepID=UPI002235FA1D|nr:uroporphyrinogen-III synthase [Salinibacterium sedimenticola]MCW4385850.1 uroporphyrinogen-III synthase [Salinibacterium sedimenticola]
MTVSRREKPLTGWRVLVPRGGAYGENVAAVLRSFGATAVVAPMINFSMPEDPAPLDEALERLESGHYDWLVVSSATTVDVLNIRGIQLPASTRIACVGETTLAALTLAGYEADLVPAPDNSPRGLLGSWPADSRSGRILVPQSDASDPALLSGLAELGLDVDVVTSHRVVGIPVTERVAADVASGRISAILISSGIVARHVMEQLGPLPESTVVACIGPRTAFDARAAGLTVDVISEDRTAEGLVEALAEFARSHGGTA